jgi:hypothetical protein
MVDVVFEVCSHDCDVVMTLGNELRLSSFHRCVPCEWGESGELLGRIDMRDATRQFDGIAS